MLTSNMFTEAQKTVLRRALPKIEKQIGQDESNLIQDILEADVDPVDAHYLVGLVLDMNQTMSFQSRVQLIKDIQKELKKYEHSSPNNL